jgi:hypothetical protein
MSIKEEENDKIFISKTIRNIRMDFIKTKIITIIFICSLLNSCEEVDLRMKYYNHAEFDATFHIDNENIIDTLPLNKSFYIGTIVKSNSLSDPISIQDTWDDWFEEYDTMYVIVRNSDSIKQLGWEHVVTNRVYEKIYKLTLNDMYEMDWMIHFPENPDENNKEK